MTGLVRPGATAAAGLLGLLVALGLAGCSGDGAEPGARTGAVAPIDLGAAGASSAAEESAEAVPVPPTHGNVEIYFPSAVDDGLIGEFHEIFATVSPGDRAKQIIADLISGPENAQALRALPQATRLRQVFVLDNGTAYLDFSPDLREGIGGGSEEEILAVYSIVNSVAISVPEIRRVGILINGRPVATLNGHLDLRRPLRPNYSLILGSAIVRGDDGGDGEPLRLASAD